MPRDSDFMVETSSKVSEKIMEPRDSLKIYIQYEFLTIEQFGGMLLAMDDIAKLLTSEEMKYFWRDIFQDADSFLCGTEFSEGRRQSLLLSINFAKSGTLCINTIYTGDSITSLFTTKPEMWGLIITIIGQLLLPAYTTYRSDEEIQQKMHVLQEQLKTEKIEQQYWQRKHEELTNELFSKRFFRKLESLKPGDEYFSEKKAIDRKLSEFYLNAIDKNITNIEINGKKINPLEHFPKW
ncbi:hypothetical protein [Nitrosospira sp. NpAV]|uniref:hypothetical protein n=1 Tax=Nitrosospira sp. NpAV TaxID=58133 RepID=UPI00059FC880|nr:hypothetical protein [Nitrosospira sp. NpAV]KIO48335.1 hypothetical protein SQ11_11230 [Nitrosospira sp. NpAV]